MNTAYYIENFLLYSMRSVFLFENVFVFQSCIWLKQFSIKWKTSGRGWLWGPALGVVKTLHTDNKQHKENMKT